MKTFREKALAKGYTPKDLERAFELQERQIFRIMANPKKIHWLALTGLPRKKKSAV